MEAAFDVTVMPGLLTVRGELDQSTGPRLGNAVDGLDGALRELDLSGVTFIDSSGLKALLTVRRRHPTVRVVNAPAVVRRLLEVTGLTDLLDDSAHDES